MQEKEMNCYKKAGAIASRARSYGITLIKKDGSILEIAKKIEDKIKELGGEIAFPVNLSLNNCAAHNVPDTETTTTLKSGDLVKLDLGVHIEGFIADTAVSILVDSNDEEKIKLIEASRCALDEVIKIILPGTKLNEIGAAIEKAISVKGFQPIKNLGGHYVEKGKLHAGVSIPNYNNGHDHELKEGDVVAIEPFATNGVGLVKEGTQINTYALLDENVVIRQNREMLDYIKKNFGNLPFAKRWLNEKFGKLKTSLFLRQMLQTEKIKGYAVLNEHNGGLVSQAEHTIIVSNPSIIITK